MTLRTIIFCLLIGSFPVLASPSDYMVQLGVYMSDITYTEPDVMYEEGNLFGFTGRIRSNKNQTSFIALEADYSSGYMDYVGSGTIENIPDKMFEIRGLIGSRSERTLGYYMSLYTGLGYRYLNDDSSYMLSSTNAIGYEREQTYIYFPIGIEFTKQTPIFGWILSGRIEYDHLIEGRNNSYTGYISGYDDLSFTQNSGYGHRFSVRFTKTLSGTDQSLSIEPFYKYWEIETSNVTYDSSGDGWIEPYNYSKEYGISLLLTL